MTHRIKDRCLCATNDLPNGNCGASKTHSTVPQRSRTRLDGFRKRLGRHGAVEIPEDQQLLGLLSREDISFGIALRPRLWDTTRRRRADESYPSRSRFLFHGRAAGDRSRCGSILRRRFLARVEPHLRVARDEAAVTLENVGQIRIDPQRSRQSIVRSLCELGTLELAEIGDLWKEKAVRQLPDKWSEKLAIPLTVGARIRATSHSACASVAAFGRCQNVSPSNNSVGMNSSCRSSAMGQFGSSVASAGNFRSLKYFSSSAGREHARIESGVLRAHARDFGGAARG